MIIKTKSGKYLMDPDGVYLSAGPNQPNFRVMSTQRLKSYAVRLVQCWKGSNDDILQDRFSKEVLPLKEEEPEGKSILVIETVKMSAMSNPKQVKRIAENIRKRNQSAMLASLEDDCDDQTPNETLPCQNSSSVLYRELYYLQF